MVFEAMMLHKTVLGWGQLKVGVEQLTHTHYS